MKTAKSANNRNVFVVTRYLIKKDYGTYKAGWIVLIISNDKGDKYKVILRTNKVHSCSCPASRRCYHINACVLVENSRAEARKLALQQAVEAICQEAEAEQRQEQQASVPARELAPLNGNRGFSMLRRAS